jgi:hypothetical protein
MTEKMLKFINVNQQNPKKRETTNRIEEQKNNLAGVLSVEFHFVKSIAH